MTETTRYSRIALAIGFLSLAGGPAVLLTDVGVALARGWRIAARVEIALLAVLAVVLGYALLALASGRGRAFLARRAGRLFALAFSVGAALVAAEVYLHTLGRPLWTSAINTRPPDLTLEFHPDPKIMPGVHGPTRYTTNDYGLRGPRLGDPETEQSSDRPYRILCLGASTTECVYLDDQKTWTRLLMDECNDRTRRRNHYWVAAAAVSGCATRDHLAFLRENPLLERFNSVIVLAGINDLGLALLDRDVPPPAPLIWSRLAIPKLISQIWSRRTAARRLEAEDPHGGNYVKRRDRRAKAKLVIDPPDLSAALDRFRRRLREMIAAARDRGVEPVLLTQPVLWSQLLSAEARGLLWMGELPDGDYLAVSSLRALIDQYNRALRDVCDEADVSCIDLAAMSGVDAYFYDDCHFNEEGAAEVAHLVADGILGKRTPKARDSVGPGIE